MPDVLSLLAGYTPGGFSLWIILLICAGVFLASFMDAIAGGVKVIRLASSLGSLLTALTAGYVYIGVGLISSLAFMSGHYLGAGLAMKNGSRIVRPTVILAPIPPTAKVGSELLCPEFWN